MCSTPTVRNSSASDRTHVLPEAQGMSSNGLPPSHSTVYQTNPVPCSDTWQSLRINYIKEGNTDPSSHTRRLSGTIRAWPPPLTTAKRGAPAGYDIIFTSGCAGLRNLDHDIASCNAVTGAEVILCVAAIEGLL